MGKSRHTSRDRQPDYRRYLPVTLFAHVASSSGVPANTTSPPASHEPIVGKSRHTSRDRQPDYRRYLPVTLFAHVASSSGVPANTTSPPASPPPGPMSMT